MRILSQNGIHDLNYDNVSLEIHGGTITAHDAAKTSFLLARYSTPERAQDEMLRLHAKYLVTKVVSGKTGITIHEDLPKIFKFDPDEVTE